MKLSKYLKEKLSTVLIFFLNIILLLLIFFAFKLDISLIIVVIFLLLISLTFILVIDYLKKRSFYNELFSNIENLDKSYLVLEMINRPDFYEGELLYDALYDINKSMNENVKKINTQLLDFKEYIEMWIHEVKIPLSTLALLEKNNKDKFNSQMKKQLKRIEDYTEQVLYYVRSENACKDYLIKEVELAKVIKNIGLKNMDDLLLEKVEFLVEDVNYKVLTDSKWLEFILGQIINNSIKYKKENNSYIKIKAIDKKEFTKLVIEDNGIGIPKRDLKKVFDKSFTGDNGRKRAKSTGMGLFIAKSLCEKLGHKIRIDSLAQKFTRVEIIFYKNDYYKF